MSFASIQSRLHAQHTFKNGPYERCRHIRILHSHPNFHHFVFRIPRSVMRKSAVLYGEYRKPDGSAENTRGASYHNAFGFYLDLMHRISTIRGKNEPVNSGKDTVVILEYVPHPDTTKRCVGWRIHVFTTRCPDVMRTLRKQLEYYTGVLAKNRPLEEHQTHYNISTLPEYVTKVCDIYNNNTKMSAILDSVYEEDGEETGECLLNPTNIFSMENALFDHEDVPNVEHDGYVFPHPEYTLRIRPNLLQPGIFYNKYLLDYFMLTVAEPEVYLRELPDNAGTEIAFQTHHPRFRLPAGFEGDGPYVRPRGFDFDAFQGMRVVYTPSDPVEYDPDARTTGFNRPPRTSFGFFEFKSLMNGARNMPTSIGMLESANAQDQPLHHQMLIRQHGLSDIDMIYLQSEDRKGTMPEPARKDMMVEEFISRCWEDPEANISAPLLAVARWFQYEYKGELFSFPCKSQDLSVFANRNVRIMASYDKLFSISAAHRTLFLLNHAKYDNWRHDMNMHINICFTGDGATSKSHQLDKAEEMSIPGICEVLTYQTTKSEAQDADANHVRYMFNEAPVGMIMKNKNMDSTQADIMKDRLINQTMRYRSLFIDEHTGKRTSVKGTSQCIATYFGATNYAKTRAEEAMQTRFHWVQSEKIHRPGANIHEKMQEAETMSRRMSKRKQDFITYHRFEDMVMALAWTFIRIKRIAEPDVSVAHRVLLHFNAHLRKAHGIKLAPRDQERIVALCKHLTIINAKEKLFHTPGGKYHRVPFDIRQVVDLEPLMVCTVEIVVFAIGLCWETIDNRNLRKVLSVLWEQHKAAPQYRTLNNVGQDRDHNYLKFPKLDRTISIVHALCPDKEGKMSKTTIETVLDDLKQQQVQTREYVPHETFDQFNDVHPEPNMDSAVRQREALILEGMDTFIHIALFADVRRENSKDVYKDCIRNLLHQHTPRRKILLGTNMRSRGAVQHPQLFDAIHIAPRDRLLIISTGVQMCPASSMILEVDDDQEQYVLDMDLDSYGGRQRGTALGLDDDDTLQLIDALQHTEQMGKHPRDNVVYPHDLMTANTERKRVLSANECSTLPTFSSKLKRQRLA